MFKTIINLFKAKKNCKNCKFNDGSYCTVGTYYAEKGLNEICFEGELWEKSN